MDRSPRMLLALLLGMGAITVQPSISLMAFPAPAGQSSKATIKPIAATTPDIPFNDSEFPTEQRLLELANQSRRQAGVSPLRLDMGLSNAAREHAQIMLDAEQLSHQFKGELSLPRRLAAATALILEQEGENVALDYDAQAGHEHLMSSPPHRANLLNPAYNVVGLGVVRSGDRLFIVQDFGRALPNYSPAEVKQRVAAAVNQMRHQARRPELPVLDFANVDSVACSMAQADKLATAPARKLAEHSTVLTYTSLHPETLPGQAAHAIGSRNLRNISVGSCYRRTATYPAGVYWIVLTLE